MGKLERWDNLKRIKFVDKKIITSLQAIGTIRNAFQYNLRHEDALRFLKEGNKFGFLNKKLDSYEHVEELVKDFKIETRNIVDKLHNLTHKVSEWIKQQ